MGLQHPTPDQMSLANILAALGDETRLAIVGTLARNEGANMTCGQFYDLGSKTNLSYHLAKLREAGVVWVEPCGTSRLISLRRETLDGLFPGLLDSIIATATKLPLVSASGDAEPAPVR